jgi:outer membrane protein assembly factor BamB
VVFGTLGGTVHGLDRASGEERWRHDSGGPVTSSPVFTGEHVVVGNRGSVLQALRPGQAQPLWRQTWWGSWVESSAVIVDGVGYIGSGDLFRVSAFDPDTGRNLWRAFVGGWVLQRPTVSGARLYAGVSGARRRARHFMPQLGGLSAIDRSTGRVAWHWPAPSVSGSFLHGLVAAPCIADGLVIAGGLDGTLHAFEDATAPSGR